MSPPTVRDYAYWRHLVGCTVLPRGDDYPEFFHRVALICTEAEEAGNQCGVWHAVSVAAGTLDRCSCHPCMAQRQAA